MRGGLLASLALACWLPLGCANLARTATEPDRGARPYVVLVSFDAFRHDYLDRYRPAAFADLAARGVRAAELIPSFPTKTFPNHYTIATGLYPGHHGLLGNVFYDPARRAWYRSGDSLLARDSSWYGGEPIWVTAERNGVKSATFFWPGSEVAIGGVRPSYWKPYDGSVPNAARVDGAMAWLRLPPGTRPHLVMLYISVVDDTTHRYGPDAAQTTGAVAAADGALQRLLDSLRVSPLEDSVNVVVVSDHGMSETTPAQVIPVVDLLLQGGVDTTGIVLGDNGPTMSLWFGADSARLRRARAVLDRSMARARAYLRSETPERWHVRENARAGDLLLVADEGFILQRRASDRRPQPGNHGYDPAVRAMHGIFLAAGPGVRAMGTVPSFENVSIYPFIAALLRLTRVPVVDGDRNALGALLR